MYTFKGQSLLQGKNIYVLNLSDNSIEVAPDIATDGAVNVPEKKWFVAYVPPRAEKSVRDKLLNTNHEAYVAARKELHIWGRGQRRIIEKVLIPCVVFVHVTNDDRSNVLTLPGVSSFMMDPAREKSKEGRRQLAVIPDTEMEMLQAILRQEEFDVEFATTNFAVGDHVRVLGFDSGDRLAQIIRLPSDKSTYVGVRLDFLGCAYMQVPTDRIIKVKK